MIFEYICLALLILTAIANTQEKERAVIQHNLIACGIVALAFILGLFLL